MNPADLALRLGRAAAARAAPLDPDVDDLAQEAALVVLRVQQARPDAPTAYLAGVARQTVRKVLTSGRRWTGLDVTRGKPPDPLRHPYAQLDEVGREPEAVRFEDGVEWAALRPEIDAAIAEIPARDRAVSQRVARGVLAGLTPSEAGRAVGVSPASGRAAWAHARSHLRHSLAHLEGLAA